jgi:hypothetical protein
MPLDPSIPRGDITYRIIGVITYLCATKERVGLLFNFGRRRLQYKRILPPKALTDWQTHMRRYL